MRLRPIKTPTELTKLIKRTYHESPLRSFKICRSVEQNGKPTFLVMTRTRIFQCHFYGDKWSKQGYVISGMIDWYDVDTFNISLQNIKVNPNKLYSIDIADYKAMEEVNMNAVKPEPSEDDLYLVLESADQALYCWVEMVMMSPRRMKVERERILMEFFKLFVDIAPKIEIFSDNAFTVMMEKYEKSILAYKRSYPAKGLIKDPNVPLLKFNKGDGVLSIRISNLKKI